MHTYSKYINNINHTRGIFMDNKIGKSKHQPKRDRYFKVRGGYAVFYNLFCSGCGEYIALYQKDGPGSLLRLYLDRMLEPKEFSNIQYEIEKSNVSTLTCGKCKTLLGVPMIYELEKRLAFRLIRGTLRKERA
jgi:ribosomal protein S27AE